MVSTFLRQLWGCFLAVAMLSGCGGGGGGGSGPAPRPPGSVGGTAISVSSNSLSTTADAAGSSLITGQVSLTVSNVPEDGVFIGVDFTTNAIVDVLVEETTGDSGIIRVVFADPAVIGPGTYADTVTLIACMDQGCISPVRGAPITISVAYVVTGVQPARPEVVLSDTMVSVEALQSSSESPVRQLSYTIRNSDSAAFSLAATHAGTGIDSVSKQSSGSDAGVFTIRFKQPTLLTSGVYTDVITITAECTSECRRGVGGVPLKINVQYTVGDTLSGPEGLTVEFIQTHANDIVWSEAHGRIYFSVSGRAPSSANTLGVLNPVTGVIEASTHVGDEPEVVNVSEDGQYIYVGFASASRILRKALPTLGDDLAIPLLDDPVLGAMFANDIQPAPGQATTIAVARRASANFSGTASGVVILDDAVARPSIAGGWMQPALNWLQWGVDNTRLYANTSENSSYAVTNLMVNATGAHILSSKDDVGGRGRMRFLDGLLYSDSGGVYDPQNQALLGTFQAPLGVTARGTVPDAAHNKLFMVSAHQGLQLRSFNLATYEPISTVGIAAFLSTSQPTRLIRWGNDGLAFIAEDGRIVLVHGPFVSAIAH